MKTSPDYNRMIVDFQTEWQGSQLDLMAIAQTLQASYAVLKVSLDKDPTPNQVISFSKVVALHQQKK